MENLEIMTTEDITALRQTKWETIEVLHGEIATINKVLEPRQKAELLRAKFSGLTDEEIELLISMRPKAQSVAVEGIESEMVMGEIQS